MIVATNWPMMPRERTKTSVLRRMPELASLLNAERRSVGNTDAIDCSWI